MAFDFTRHTTKDTSNFKGFQAESVNFEEIPRNGKEMKEITKKSTKIG